MAQSVLLHCQLWEVELEAGCKQGGFCERPFMAQSVLLYCQPWEVGIRAVGWRASFRAGWSLIDFIRVIIAKR